MRQLAEGMLRAVPEEEDATQDRTESSRGRGTLVFVPWSQVNSHDINLHKSEMDVWIPG
jgi:F-box only protein C-terminal region